MLKKRIVALILLLTALLCLCSCAKDKEYDPDYFVISVGEDNRYGHPHSETMALIEDMVVKAKGQAWEDHVFRTDERGDVTVRSNGKEIFVETSKR